ncbi:hypothetical protein [Belliella pelovolcani]|uniref:hypothetical protein n=1 Tax=Belliella pelovolcani TaxID=529505 RepID=UPI00391CAA08
MKTLERIKKFAKTRERAYRMSGFLSQSRAKAISEIIKKSEYYSQKSELVQLKAVVQLEDEICALLPHEESRFQKLRTEILEILNNAKSTVYGHNLS